MLEEAAVVDRAGDRGHVGQPERRQHHVRVEPDRCAHEQHVEAAAVGLDPRSGQGECLQRFQHPLVAAQIPEEAGDEGVAGDAEADP